MGTIVVAAAASHSPVITMMYDENDAQQARFHAAMHQIGEAFAAAKPDVIITITNEHFVNFYLDNVPAMCIGTATSYFGPVEPFLKIPQADLPGDRSIGKRLVAAALDAEFDVAYSEELRFDHGTMVPMSFVNADYSVPVVPIIVNNIYAPMPSPKRMYAFGQFLGRAIAEQLGDVRVALLATGGLSHKVGTPDTGDLDPEFDRRFLDGLARGEGSRLAASLTHDELHAVGNGTHEVRNWLAVMGALGDVPGEVLAYEPIPVWVTGCGAALWRR